MENKTKKEKTKRNQAAGGDLERQEVVS